jgi:hypothetical protein
MRGLLPVVWLVMAGLSPGVELVRAPDAGGEAPAAIEEVRSRSGQFRVIGGDSLLRGSVALLAEQTKDELLRVTAGKDEWKIPVAIRLHGAAGDPMPARTVVMSLLVVEGVAGLRIDVHLSRGIEQVRFKRGVTKALLYERVLATGAAAAEGRALSVPPWLAEGLCEAASWSLNESDRRLYEALFRHGGLFKLDALFSTDELAHEEMDGASRAAFRVSSGALVMALLEQPRGREEFRGFLAEAAAHEGEMPVLLRKHFPGLNLSESSLAKWWALQLAAKGGVNPLVDVLTIAQSEAALGEALRLNVRGGDGIAVQKPLSSWPDAAAMDGPGRAEAVRQAQDSLVRLSYRCFPAYRPLLGEYQTVLDAIARGRTDGVAEKLARLDEARGGMMARAERARDYLDWFEITRARETSGAFDDYQRLKERLRENPRLRDDGISAYLDRMDRIFHRRDAAPQMYLPPP